MVKKEKKPQIAQTFLPDRQDKHRLKFLSEYLVNKSDDMKFSIITAVKNNKPGLLRAIECVQKQTYKNVEHIIIDGGSTDGSVELLRECEAGSKEYVVGSKKRDDLLHTDHYLLRTISEPDNGIYDAINKGINLAEGDVIGLLHSDDLYADNRVLERYAEAFGISSKKFEVDAVYSDLVYIRKKSKVKSTFGGQKSKDESEILDYISHQIRTDSTGIKTQSTTYSLLPATYSILRNWKTQKKEFTAESQRRRAILNGWMPPHPTLFIRKEVFEKYGLYRTDMKIAADYEMILRLFYKHRITSYYLPYTTYLMTTGGASNKSFGNIILKSKEDYRGMRLQSIRFPLMTLILKNLRKISQFYIN